MKFYFYKRYAYRVEQVIITKKVPVYYVNKITQLIHTMISLISLYPTDTLQIDRFLNDLNNFSNYSYDSGQIGKAFQYLRRGKLITFDLKGKNMIRKPELTTYFTTILTSDKSWPNIFEEWKRAYVFIYL